MLVLVVAGYMITVSALAARGEDLRPDRTTDLAGLVHGQSRRVDSLNEQAAQLRREVNELSQVRVPNQDSELLAKAEEASALYPVKGPAVKVVLTDAPLEVKPAGVHDDLLVVHQQDIQAVVNALWSGGAEAMSIQNERVVSTTGIKCVGNSVVLHGVPHAPPYVIIAIGDQARLEAALNGNDAITVYKQYAEAYGLGYQKSREDAATLPAYDGSIELRYARRGR